MFYEILFLSSTTVPVFTWFVYETFIWKNNSLCGVEMLVKQIVSLHNVENLVLTMIDVCVASLCKVILHFKQVIQNVFDFLANCYLVIFVYAYIFSIKLKSVDYMWSNSLYILLHWIAVWASDMVPVKSECELVHAGTSSTRRDESTKSLPTTVWLDG